MYFISFTVNILAWTVLGLFIGYRAFLMTRENENAIFLSAGLGGLGGGILSSLTHGMYPEIGIDLFNLVFAGSMAFTSLYLFVPKTRNVFFVRIARELKTRYRILSTPTLWRRNITSLIPR